MLTKSSSTIPVKQAKKLYLQDGLSLAAIASHFGTSRETLRDMFDREGIPRRKGWQTRCHKAPTAEIARLYFEEKLVPAKIAERVGLTEGAVRSRLIRAGCQLRPRGGKSGHFKRPEVKTEDLVRDFSDEHLNYSQISERRGISIPGVIYRLKQTDCKLPEHNYHPVLPWDKIIFLYCDQKISGETIARPFKVGANTIYRGLEERGIELRERTAHMSGLWAERKQKIARVDVAEQDARDLRAKVEVLEDRLRIETGGQAAVIRSKVKQAIEKFTRLFSLPVIEGNPILLLDGWTHPEYSKKEIASARAAVIARARNKPVYAAQHFVSEETRKKFETVTRYHRGT
jgi:transposase-like protein